MADTAHLDWLLLGAPAWNERRLSHDFQPDFSDANIFEAFREAKQLDPNGRVPLAGFDFRDTIFNGADLSQIDFIGANLSRSKLLGAQFKNTSFFQADLTEALFGPCYLGEVDFGCATLQNTDLTGANFATAKLGWSRLWEAKLYSAFVTSATSSSPSHSTDPIRQHCIGNIAELIDCCFQIKERHPEFLLYFRGERDASWQLCPSVMRKSDDHKFKLRPHEGQMLRDLVSRRPEDFSGMIAALEQLVMAQHHGLKTRLLDVTHNPCIALFSACDSRDPGGFQHPNTMDGRIHVFAVPKELIRPFDSDTISIVANFAKLDRSYQNLLLGKTGEDSELENPEVRIQYIYEDAMRRLYHFIRQEKPHFEVRIDPRDFFRVFVVEPKQSFDRIRAQEGAFLVSAFHERFERDQIQSWVPHMMVYEHETIIVPSGQKESILQELSLLNFTRQALYPSLDEVANRITQHYL